jgi:hypothetical protein
MNYALKTGIERVVVIEYGYGPIFISIKVQYSTGRTGVWSAKFGPAAA